MFLGFAIHILKEITKAINKHGDKFSFARWITFPKNYVYLTICLLSSLVIILSVEMPESASIEFGQFKFNALYILSGVAGYLNASLFKGLVDVINPNKKK